MEPGLSQFLLLCLGGGLGSMARAGLVALSAQKLRAIYLINLSGSFLIGLAFGLHSQASANSGQADLAFAFFAIGLLGGYTTVSTHALQVLGCWQDGQRRAAITLALGAVLTCPLAAWAGAQTVLLGGW